MTESNNDRRLITPTIKGILMDKTTANLLTGVQLPDGSDRAQELVDRFSNLVRELGIITCHWPFRGHGAPDFTIEELIGQLEAMHQEEQSACVEKDKL